MSRYILTLLMLVSFSCYTAAADPKPERLMPTETMRCYEVKSAHKNSGNETMRMTLCKISGDAGNDTCYFQNQALINCRGF